ncbi:class I SAM-dependent rRNA methyltransferase [Bacillus sp. FSL W7-1360]
MVQGEMRIQLDKDAAKQLRAGYPLLHKEWFTHVSEPLVEGAFLRLLDEKGQFLARGYYGTQNVGCGWVLTYDAKQPFDRTFFAQKLQQAFEKRASLFASEETTVFRVFHGEGDGIGGLTIDYYDGFYVLTWYSEGIYSFRTSLLKALADVTTYEGVYEKKRFAQAGQYVTDDDFVCGTRGAFPLLVKENSIQFAVYLNDGPMTGIFLDQRDVRKRIRDHYAAGKTVLNLFSYTGAFSVAAALGGATATTSVDVANRSVPRTEEQFRVNELPLEEAHMYVIDAFRYCAYARKKGMLYDLIVLDPPSFARTKKRTFRAAKDYSALLSEAMMVTKVGGVIIASTNASNVSLKAFKRFVTEAQKMSGGRYEVLETFGLPKDFPVSKAYPQGRYLKVLIMKKLSA